MKATTVLATFGAGVLGAMAVGAASNMVNGAVCPAYFRVVMGWDSVTNIWRASVADGLLEGALFGAMLSLVFTAVLFARVGRTVTFAEVTRLLLRVLGCALIGWIIGGAVGAGIAALSPEMFRVAFVAPSGAAAVLLPFAWVGGSIWGLEFGALAGTVLTLVTFLRQEHNAFRSVSPLPVS